MNAASLIKLGALLGDLRATASKVATDAVVERGAGWIRELQAESPHAHKLLMSVLYESPGDVINALAEFSPALSQLQTNAQVLDYITRLQAKLRDKQTTAPLDPVTIHPQPLTPRAKGKKHMPNTLQKSDLLDMIKDMPDDAELCFGFAGEDDAWDIEEIEIDTNANVITFVAADDSDTSKVIDVDPEDS